MTKELLNGTNGTLIKRGNRTKIEELTTRIREEQTAELAPRTAHRQALELAIHQTLENYQAFIKTVDLADYKAFARVLQAAILISPPEFVEEAIKLRARVDHFITAIEESSTSL